MWHGGFLLVFDHAAFLRATIIEQVAVKFDDFLTARTLVQAVDILRDQRKPRHQLGEARECQVARIGISRSDEFAAPAIPLPDQLGIFFERLRSRELMSIVFFP